MSSDEPSKSVSEAWANAALGDAGLVTFGEKFDSLTGFESLREAGERLANITAVTTGERVAVPKMPKPLAPPPLIPDFDVEIPTDPTPDLISELVEIGQLQVKAQQEAVGMQQAIVERVEDLVAHAADSAEDARRSRRATYIAAGAAVASFIGSLAVALLA